MNFEEEYYTIKENQRMKTLLEDLEWIEKMSRAQSNIHGEEQTAEATTRDSKNLATAYELMGHFNRCINLLVDSVSQINYDVGNQLPFTPTCGRRPGKKLLNSLINYKPAPYWDTSDFRRTMFMDLLMEGSIFLEWDGSYLYPMASRNMKIESSKRNRVVKFTYQGADETNFKPEEVLWVRDNNYYTGVTGHLHSIARAAACMRDLRSLEGTEAFQNDVYKNWATIGYAVESEAAVSRKVRKAMIEEVRKLTTGVGRTNIVMMPMGAKVHDLKIQSLRDMNTIESMKDAKDNISRSLGIPPEMLGGVQGADMKSATEVFWNQTVLPMAHKLRSAMEAFFGYDLELDTSKVRDLQPDRNKLAAYLNAGLNGGWMSVNEVRSIARMSQLKLGDINGPDEYDPDKPTRPANIAAKGSAVNPTVGGRPEDDNNEENNE